MRRELSRRLISMLYVLIAASSCVTAESIQSSDLHDRANGMQGEEEYDTVIDVGHGVHVPVHIEMSAKGNGTMQLCKQEFRVVDCHDDGRYYDDQMLDVDFVDLDGDGYKDMVISGLVHFTGEKGDKDIRLEPVVFIYRFNPKTREYKQTFRKASFEIEEAKEEQEISKGQGDNDALENQKGQESLNSFTPTAAPATAPAKPTN